MIILEGPDATGKTKLAVKIMADYDGHPYKHFVKESIYTDYLEPLADLSMFWTVCDRFIFSEAVYSEVMERKSQFTDKQWHNVTLLALAMNPLITLMIHKPNADYSKDQYLPKEKWDKCLSLYREFFKKNNIPFVEFDYASDLPTQSFLEIESRYAAEVSWWLPMWREGIGMIGSQHPKFLIVGQEIGPNNVHNLPFETGPTGYMMSEMLAKSEVPLGDIAITNIAKVRRGVRRPVNSRDLELFEIELTHLKPQKVILMGKLAREGIPVLKSLGIEYGEMPHLGWFRRTGRSGYVETWRELTAKPRSIWEL